MRTASEILEEIQKVEEAHIAAIKKQQRCEERLKELEKELQEAEEGETNERN